jgi:hypothetical protein
MARCAGGWFIMEERSTMMIDRVMYRRQGLGVITDLMIGMSAPIVGESGCRQLDTVRVSPVGVSRAGIRMDMPAYLAFSEQVEKHHGDPENGQVASPCCWTEVDRSLDLLDCVLAAGAWGELGTLYPLARYWDRNGRLARGFQKVQSSLSGDLAHFLVAN